MNIKLLISLAFILCTLALKGQTEEGKYTQIGIEIQQYPTGFLFGAHAEIGLNSHHAIDFRLGYNLLDHQDFGVHDDEKGGGFGFSAGYRYYFKPNNQAWFLGARTDLWFNEVEWKDLADGAIEAMEGTTNVTVLQPTAMIGYVFVLNERLILTPTLAFGAEINIKTKGADVGEGAIFLWGLNAAYRF